VKRTIATSGDQSTELRVVRPPGLRRAGLLLLAILAFGAAGGACAAIPERSPAVASAGTGSTTTVATPLPATPATLPGVPARPTGPTAEAQLVRIVDGDTIRVLVDGVEEPVRYIGIDTPEPNATSVATPEPFAQAATDANARLLAAGGSLRLERDVSDRDRYGRLLRHAWVEDDGRWTLVGLALLAEGFAQVTTYPPDVKYVDPFLAAQRSAREAGRGLWATAP
jgi:micrococcal nuclease